MSFNPTPQTAAQVLERFISARHSLTEIAAEFGTNLFSLCEWANRPDIRRALGAIEADLAAKARAAARAALPLALATLAKLDAEYPLPPRKPRAPRKRQTRGEQAPPAPPASPTPPSSFQPPALASLPSPSSSLSARIIYYRVYPFRLPRHRFAPVLAN